MVVGRAKPHTPPIHLSKGPSVSRMHRVLLMGPVIAALLPAAAASAHAPLPPNDYGCLNKSETQLVNRNVQIKPGREYAFKKGNGERLGKAGEFAHTSDSAKIRFTSGYLANNGWRGTHVAITEGDYPTFHKVILKRYVDGEVVTTFKCSPQSG